MTCRPSADLLHVGPDDLARIVRAKGLGASIAGVAERIEREFRRWPEFDKSARTASHSRDGVIELMPIADRRHYAFKYVNGHPRNPRDGLPTVMAFGVLADVASGAPRLLAELTITTAIRTAAMSASAARALARRDSRSMALIGNGAQSEFQAVAFAELLGVRELRLHDVDPHATAKLMRNLDGRGFDMRACASVADAVAGADIVTTVTADKHRATILTPAMIEPGMHVNAVGGDCPGKTELHRGVLDAATVFVEYEPQTRVEGDVQQMPADFPVVEFWRVLAGHHPGRRSRDEVTVFDSVGFALEDFAALGWLRDAARELGVGRRLELIAQAPDPKDLFGALRDGAAQTAQAA